MSSLLRNMAKGDGLTNGAPLGHEVVCYLYIAAELKSNHDIIFK
jgi:hypothetical protein